MTDDELNRAVAERVMGWRQANRAGTDWWSSEVVRRFRYSDWSPATCPDHAAMVMERMWQEWEFELRSNPDSVAFDARFHLHAGKRPEWTTADTWTRAVCLAALKAREE